MSYRSDARSQEFSASVYVQGDLNETELADIRELLSSLAGGEQPEDPGSVSAYQYSYQRSREVSRATITQYA